VSPGTGLRLLLLEALLSGACARLSASTQPVSDTSSQQVWIASRITPAEFRFDPNTLRLRANVPVRLTFDNHLRPDNSGGALAHDFTIDNFSGRGPLNRLAGYRVHIAVAADSEAVGEFTLPAGTYEFYCSVDRHALDGMIGTVTVSE
jgi:plastocyanin